MQPLPIYMALSDFDDLIELALANGDKEWFLELVRRRKELEEVETKVRRDLGFGE